MAIFIPGCEPNRVELRESNTFGRASSCEVWVNEPNVSRRHCTIERDGRRWMLIDLDSTNGTWLDAARVRRYALRDGETFYIGDSRIVFHADQWIENRPVDPHEASQFAQILPETDRNAETHMEMRAKRRLPTPAISVAGPRSKSDASLGANSIAFRRPPARPIVKSASSGGWVGALVARVRGK